MLQSVRGVRVGNVEIPDNKQLLYVISCCNSLKLREVSEPARMLAPEKTEVVNLQSKVTVAHGAIVVHGGHICQESAKGRSHICLKNEEDFGKDRASDNIRG
ncbi:hypothetical protein MLD38_013029 [Melastoma candidum]|uniref:Uncharacterized protein n=1 Tax=Melastoma candidum TaxID=119954 RepID=A0ACB9R8D2_9MYRT|nr:hypothetical protein MLD38_013029 [Melastoma candidum]